MTDQKNYLYKYRAIDDSNLKWSSRIFTHNELYFPNKNQLNDPFDCKSDYSFKATTRELNGYFRNSLSRAHPDWNRQQKQRWITDKKKALGTQKFQENLKVSNEKLMSEIGIYSLSRIPDDILMWSHYADSHKGFCLKFYDDVNDRFIARAQEIKYSKEYPVVNPIRDNDMARLEKTLLTKSKHWEYEEEWRIIDHEEGPGIKQYPPHLLVGVIFGCRMSDANKKIIRTWCKGRKGLSFFQAQEASGTYTLDVIEI